MKVAFVPYTADPSGIPDGWPATSPRVIRDDEPILDGEIAMSEQDYATHIENLTTEKEAWNSSRKDTGPGRQWNRTEFKNLFTDLEWAAFRAAEKAGNPYAEAVWEDLLLVTTIEQKNPRTRQALGALAAIGVISPNRIDQILA